MNPKIEDVKIDMELLHSELNARSIKQRNLIIRKHAGGTCTYCGEIPNKKLKYDIGDGDKLVEFYCDPCFQKHKSELDKQLQNINFT